MNCFPNANFSFEEIRKRGLSYVDKTGHALRLLTSLNTTSFFLSRPRRFGKSLFLSTLKSALEGKAELFDGLAMNRGNYGFEKFSVIHLDMSYVDSS
ncbi:MAG: AAA family ATPase, partial [Deltaproteobacteria bacterium]|nr:AAA family ATPase [Deltaproteobacteria bacterium]